MGIRTYKTYRFLDKDPVIDQLRTIVKDSGMSYREIAGKSGISKGTLQGWFHGKTKRPQYATVMAAARALGWDYRLVQVGQGRANQAKAKARLEARAHV